MCTHVYPSNTVYPVYPYITCLPMFTLVILLFDCLESWKAEIMVLLRVLLKNRQVVSFILKSTLQPLKKLNS